MNQSVRVAGVRHIRASNSFQFNSDRLGNWRDIFLAKLFTKKPMAITKSLSTHRKLVLDD